MMSDDREWRSQYNTIEVPEWALICVCRYAMGRRTDIVADTTALIRVRWPQLSDDTRRILRRHLKAEIEMEERVPGALGADMDVREWMQLYAFMQREEGAEG